MEPIKAPQAELAANKVRQIVGLKGFDEFGESFTSPIAFDAI